MLFYAQRDWLSAKQTTEKEWWKRFCCLIEEFQASGCVFQDIERLTSNSFLRKGTILGTKAQRAILKGVDYATWKFGKEKVHRKAWFSTPVLMCAVFMLQNLRTSLKKRLWDKSDAPAETRGKWQNVFSSSKKRTKLHSSRLWMFGAYRRRLHRNQMCKTSEPHCTYNGYYRDSTDPRGYARSPYRLENSAKITDILMSGSRKRQEIQCDTENFVLVNLDLPARLRGHRQHPKNMTQCEMIPRQVQQTHEAGLNAVGHWETSCGIPKVPKTKIRMRTPAEHGEARCGICLNGCRNSPII